MHLEIIWIFFLLKERSFRRLFLRFLLSMCNDATIQK
jgi:hypothetical protein